MKRDLLFLRQIAGFFLIVGGSVINLAAQEDSPPPEMTTVSPLEWWFVMVIIMAVGLSLAIFLWKKSKTGEDQPQYNYGNRYRGYHSESHEGADVDAAKELEWLRKSKKPKQKQKVVAKKATTFKLKKAVAEPDLDTKEFQEKMRKLQYTQLPINSFTDLGTAAMYTPLQLSSDPALVSAIDQANEEFEEDESVRDLAVRILIAFRTRNSIEALSQIALYDLSSNLRSKAVATLADFDHESVFETILLACADPTREVRAAAARGLFRLNFDRGDAWKRIIETEDVFRMSHAARAAIEAGIVTKSFERLIHEDHKIAFEAVALVTLLIRSGETNELFDTLQNHKDERIKFALLHVLKVNKDERALERLREISVDSTLATDVAERVREAIASYEPVAV